MAKRTRIWSAVAAVSFVSIVGATIVFGGGESSSDLPRIRGSAPGLDTEMDLFADGSQPDGDDGAGSEVIEIDSVDKIRAAFDADHGHPRLILLVDPI